jgi:hypothetical protein
LAYCNAHRNNEKNKQKKYMNIQAKISKRRGEGGEQGEEMTQTMYVRMNI